VLAAYRAGLRQLIMPKMNEKDLRDVPDEVKKQVTFTFVDRMDEVLRLALLPPAESDMGPPDVARTFSGNHAESSTAVPVSTEPSVSVTGAVSPDGPALDSAARDEATNGVATSPV
jgi:hypothetical protein